MTHGNHAINKRAAILIENGFEDVEFQVPYQGLKMAGIEVVVLGSQMNQEYKGKQNKVSIQTNGTTTVALAIDFDAVVIPGGIAPAKMRINPNTIRFVQEAMAQGKLVAAVSHGPQVLISADLLKGKRATSFIDIRQDLVNAGATYLDRPFVIDDNLLTARQPGDLAIFTTALLNRLGYGGKEVALPNENDVNAEWWKLADAWGGSTKGEIVQALNTALVGEHYSQETLEHYVEKIAQNLEVRSLLQEMIQNKQQTIQVLEARLHELGEKPSLKIQAADAYAKFKTMLQGNDEMFLLRSALHITQIGAVDSYELRHKYTDPKSTAIFTQMQADLTHHEQRLGQLYRSWMVAQRQANIRAGTGTTA
ncbi:MAG: DJ-1/PfpI/YhbO family deglycase/protease [Chroococcidiopsidaceae cyanobacterium CP_BM_ER_R8_30]|nr:DJ-1/PfpI/YhbO family deglycase/protease [Chroococcidiopsidaceae cyanobacterium CP_BM_ER_R8_30]